MEFRIDYDPEAFRVGTGSAEGDPVPEAVRRGMTAIADRLQTALDRVFRSHAGRPVDEVAEQVRVVSAADGFELTQEDVAVCARTIAEGRRLDVSVGYH